MQIDDASLRARLVEPFLAAVQLKAGLFSDYRARPIGGSLEELQQGIECDFVKRHLIPLPDFERGNVTTFQSKLTASRPEAPLEFCSSGAGRTNCSSVRQCETTNRTRAAC